MAVSCNKSCIMAVVEQEALEPLLLKRRSFHQISLTWLTLPHSVVQTSV
ncbi:MAG: hypothetical protein WBB28_05290 [Crinalium sp.]